MLEQNAVSQGLNVALRKHQHFDWAALGIAGLTGGILGSGLSRKMGNTLNELDHNSGLLHSELKSIITAGTESALTGTHFDAAQVLTNNLGDAVGNALVNTTASKTPIEQQLDELSLEKELQSMREEAKAFNYYLAQQSEKDNLMLYGSDLPGFTGEIIYNNSADLNGKAPLAIKDSKFNPPLRFNEEEESNSSLSHKIQVSRLSIWGETRMDATNYRFAAGVVSKGDHDPGGVSYGAFQLASATENIQKFLKGEGAQWASEFEGLDPKIKDGPFSKKWKEIANRQGEDFFMAQFDYIYRTHYKYVNDYLKKETGLDINTQPEAIQAAVFSASVQHKNAKYFLADAIKSVKVKSTEIDYYPTLINTIYDKRVNYVQDQKKLESRENIIKKRYAQERIMALNMLK